MGYLECNRQTSYCLAGVSRYLLGRRNLQQRRRVQIHAGQTPLHSPNFRGGDGQREATTSHGDEFPGGSEQTRRMSKTQG